MNKKLANSQLSNYKTYQMYLRQMLNLAENVFEFVNLPAFIDLSYLNKQLLRNGSIAFFYDEEMQELLALPYHNLSVMDVYGRPTKIEVIGQNGYTRVLNRGEFVIMYDNNGRYPLYLDILQMAERISLCKRVEDINLSQQRTPRIWLTSSDKVESVKAVLNQYDGNVEEVLAYDTLDLDDITAICEPAPFVTDKVDVHLDKEWAEFFRLIGIANIQEQKRERVIRDEMIASQGGTIASRFSRFNPRKVAVDEINRLWGDKLNEKIEVKYYDGIPSTIEEVEEYDISMDDSTVLTD